jgi:hypothetical protein
MSPNAGMPKRSKPQDRVAGAGPVTPTAASPSALSARRSNCRRWGAG